VGGRDVELKLRHEPGQAGDLALRDLQHQPGERGRVDDGMLQRALEAATHEPGVKRVMAVLHEHSAVRETEEGAPRVLEHRRADEHRAVDVVALARIRVDRRAAVDQGVEEGQRALEREAFGSQLEHEERRVARGLDVEGHELGLVEWGERPDLGRVDRDLLPGHRRRAARL